MNIHFYKCPAKKTREVAYFGLSPIPVFWQHLQHLQPVTTGFDGNQKSQGQPPFWDGFLKALVNHGRFQRPTVGFPQLVSWSRISGCHQQETGILVTSNLRLLGEHLAIRHGYHDEPRRSSDRDWGKMWSTRQRLVSPDGDLAHCWWVGGRNQSIYPPGN